MKKSYDFKNIKFNIIKKTLQIMMLFIGIFVLALGVVIMIECNLGVQPWDVFHIGLYNKLKFLTLGQVNILAGMVLIFISYLFTDKTYNNHIFKHVFFGIFLDLIYYLDIVIVPESLLGRYVYFFSR